ncbi:hypothetical protein PEC18_19340 [Paucibacter sp. O1-1]|nr:hypothetical protein [Paucibacter sp. O1-1]MDA3827942.1 hypothetical protein [Paucibacter sp. O1-1]
MLKDFATLEEISDGSGAPLPDVIDYVNAYYAVGFVDHDRAKPGEVDAIKGGVARLRNPFG